MTSVAESLPVEKIRATRRKALQAAGVALGMGGLAGEGVAWDGASINADEEPTEAAQQQGQGVTEFPPEPTPRDVGQSTYEMLHGHRKREVILKVLTHPEVNQIIKEFYGSFEGYDDWVDFDSLGLNGCRNIQIENAGRKGLEQGTHRVTATGTQWMRAVVNKEDELTKLQITQPTDYQIVRNYGEAEKRILLGTIQKEPVRRLLRGKDWYVGIGKVTSISTYSPEYRKAEITFPVFFLPRGNEYILVDTGIEVKNFPDNPQPGELVYAQAVYPWDAQNVKENKYGIKPTGRVREPLPKLANMVSVDNSLPAASDMPNPQPSDNPWIFRGPGHYSAEVKTALPKPVKQNGWTVDWRDTQTDGMIFNASYNGTKVLDRAACSVSLTAYPPHGKRYSTDQFVAPRARIGDPHGNVMFHDNLGLTGPGVLGKMDLPPINKPWAPERPPGFKIRTHYHTGATSVREFHAGMRYGPYNYVIDWQFFEDGVLIPTYQRNGPGYEAGHNWPVYASMFAFIPTPGGQQNSEVFWFDGDTWNEQRREGKLIADGSNNILRVKQPGGSNVIDFPLELHDEVYVLRAHNDEMGVAQRVKNQTREKNFWHPIQYANDERVFGERVVVWVIHTTHTSTVPYKSGTVPFVNQAEMRVGQTNANLGS